VQVAEAFAALKDERWAVVDAGGSIEAIHAKVTHIGCGMPSD
jgi:hypothetical protein